MRPGPLMVPPRVKSLLASTVADPAKVTELPKACAPPTAIKIELLLRVKGPLPRTFPKALFPTPRVAALTAVPPTYVLAPLLRVRLPFRFKDPEAPLTTPLRVRVLGPGPMV